MTSSKPKKGFSMSLSKTKLPSSSASVVRTDRDRFRAKPSSIGQRDGEEAEAAPKRDYVTGIGGGKVVTKEVVVERGPRVIALAPNPWAATTTNGEKANSAPSPADAGAGSNANADGPMPRQPSSTAPALSAAPAPAPADEDKSLDELAAEALARESRNIGRGRSGGAGDRDGLGLDSDRVITMTAQPNVTSSSNGSGEAGTTTTGGKRNGLLELNMIPGLAEVEGEDAKFKHDLGYRAEDVSARSMAYVDVPVHEFGAALLRGMGWEGPGGNDEGAGGRGTAADLVKDVEPRHHRLGLGAQPKPPEEMKRPRKRKPGEKDRASDVERRKIWEDKAREEQARASRPSASQLSVMDVVEISGGSAGGGGRRARAMVMKTQGVPGLNKISVRMEDSGETAIVDKASLSRVSEDDLARRPFSDKRRVESKPDAEEPPVRRRDDNASGGWESGDGSRNDNAKRSRNRSRSRSVERDGDGADRRDGKRQGRSKKEKKKHKKRKSDSSSGNRNGNGSSKRERNDRASPSPRSEEDEIASRGRPIPSDRDNDGRKADRRRDDASPNRKRPRDSSGRNGVNGEPVSVNRQGGGGGGAGGGGSPERSWLRANIRVRVVHKSYAGGRAYLGKGKVVDVPRMGEATVRMDLGDLVLEGVKQRHLETVLPARGGKVIVVRGAEKGVAGKLLAKDKERQTALVQVYEDLRAMSLSLDDVAEFTGMLDNDVEDIGF